MFAIKIAFNDGTVGLMSGENGDVRTFQNEDSAIKEIRKLKSKNHYSFTNCTIEPVIYDEAKPKKGRSKHGTD